jgi:hypothetical protein
MNKLIEKITIEKQECSRCVAEFEIWLSNSKISEEKREKMGERLLANCPSCSRVEEG